MWPFQAWLNALIQMRQSINMRSKALSLLYLILGAWLGGSILVGTAAGYNFAGFDDLFERNPRLAERAGFRPEDPEAKKASLLWVHSSELNRVMFESWNLIQLVLGVLAIALALSTRAGWIITAALCLAVALISYAQLFLSPELVDLGRRLDFVPRNPPPAELAPFRQLHGRYFALEALRFLLVVLAAVLLAFRPFPVRDPNRG